MKKYIFSFGVIFLIAIAFVLSWNRASAPRGPYVTINNVAFSVEVVDTPEAQEKGLGFRDALCKTCAMLFLFNHPAPYGFWMRGMRFPLDILWIRDGKIIHIERNLDFHDQQKVYAPTAPADRVLELNAGTCEKNGIREGDMVSFEKM